MARCRQLGYVGQSQKVNASLASLSISPASSRRSLVQSETDSYVSPAASTTWSATSLATPDPMTPPTTPPMTPPTAAPTGPPTMAPTPAPTLPPAHAPAAVPARLRPPRVAERVTRSPDERSVRLASRVHWSILPPTKDSTCPPRLIHFDAVAHFALLAPLPAVDCQLLGFDCSHFLRAHEAFRYGM